MKKRLFTISYRTEVFQVRVTTDNKLFRFLGRMQVVIGHDVPISYREQGAVCSRTFDVHEVIGRCGGLREYACFIGHSLM